MSLVVVHGHFKRQSYCYAQHMRISANIYMSRWQYIAESLRTLENSSELARTPQKSSELFRTRRTLQVFRTRPNSAGLFYVFRTVQNSSERFGTLRSSGLLWSGFCGTKLAASFVANRGFHGPGVMAVIMAGWWSRSFGAKQVAVFVVDQGDHGPGLVAAWLAGGWDCVAQKWQLVLSRTRPRPWPGGGMAG